MTKEEMAEEYKETVHRWRDSKGELVQEEDVKEAYIAGAKSREKRITELEKENAELDCQMKRNTYCYSCANATERCFRNEIGCPCDKYKSYKDENAELKAENERLKSIKDVATLINANNSIVVTLLQLNNNLVYANQLINKLKKCDNCKENTTMNPYCIDCEHHSKWVLAD